ncbi:MAG: dTDP-4-dehydrorhamnose 3,5-epimerase [Alphaproteobacteria bacterium]|nr:dTDP-4-dehydrorhamnose 3,5-epimerase [Alphaproteobacteria bacterium]
MSDQHLSPPVKYRVVATGLPEVKIITPQRIGDSRGFFSEVWNDRDFAAAGIEADFVQDNHIRNPLRGTLRGLHYQLPPTAQGKLVRVTRGAILDVAVDIRRGSPNFARDAAVLLSAENWQQLWVPVGFAHGYCTLEDDTEVQYKVTDFYSPPHERGIAWDDPALAIRWPIDAEALIISDRDRALPRLAAQPDLFDYVR